MACAKAGIPVGLLQQGELYILLPKSDKGKLPEALIDKMGSVVTVTGAKYKAGGVTFLTVETVE